MVRTLMAVAFATFLTAGAATAAPAQQHPYDALFTKYDTNKDGFLDAAELAKAYRGPNAKPVEHKETGKPHVETKHPDHAFLEAYDTNHDDKISKAEFERHEQRLVAQAKSAAAAQKAQYSRQMRAKHYRAPQRHSHKKPYGRRR